MLIIRSEQMEAMGRTTEEAFEKRLLEHIRAYFPVHWREAGASQLRLLIRLGLEQAEKRGFETQREIFLYVSLMLYLGSHFDTDPMFSWAAAGLADSTQESAFARIEKTFDATLDYLDRVEGPARRQARVAARHFLSRLEQAPPSGSPKPTVEKLAAIYPEKHREANPSDLDRLVQECVRGVREHKLATERGGDLYLGLMFLLGHGFSRDPQFHWASEIVDPSVTTGTVERVEALHQAAKVRLPAWFGGTGDR